MQGRRTLHAAIVAAVVAVVAVLAWMGRDPRPLATEGRAAAGARRADAGQPRAPATPPAPQGTLTIEGEVRGPGGPVAGAVVTATIARDGDVLSEVRCHCGNDCGERLLECGCGEAAGQLVALVAERRGETPPVARATTGADGRFVLGGLADGTYAVWAETGAAAGVAEGVRPGAAAVIVGVDGGARISGKVARDDGTGISRAVVTAIHGRHGRFFDVLTGAEGAFTLGPLPDGDYTVVASSPGLLPARARVERGDRAKVRLELLAPRRLAGRVTLEGVPTGGVVVGLRGEHRKVELTTDAGGSFAFGALRPGEYQLLATLGDRVAQEAVTVPRRRDVDDVTLALAAGVTVDGTVVDDTGAPIAGAKVRLDRRAPRPRMGAATATTDGAGRFRFGPIAPGELELAASRDGYLPATDEEVRVAAVESRTVTLALQRARRIEGKVVDREGTPVAGAVVVASPRGQGSDVETSDRTGTDGAFGLDLRGGGYALQITHELFRPGEASVEAPARGLVVRLEPGAGIEGEVLDEDGKPVRGAHVAVVAAAPQQDRAARRATTDARGRFRLGGLDPGTVFVIAQRSMAELAATAVARVEVPPEGAAPVRLRFEAGLALAGTVVDPDGAPLAGVKVWAHGAERNRGGGFGEFLAATSQGQAESDDAGRFTIRGLRGGEHLVTAGKEGFWQPTPPPRVRPGDAEVRVVLSRRAAVRGRVVGEGGAPLASARVNGRLPEEGDGRFSVPIAADGPLTLVFTAEGHAPLERSVDVTRAADLDLGDVTLGRGREVTGVVVDGVTGAPVPAARVTVVRDVPVVRFELDDRDTQVTVTGPDGAFAVHHAPDRSRLRVEATGYAPVSVTIPEVPGALRVALGRGGSLGVRVLRATGEPMARVEVAAFTRDGAHRSGKTDADGRWEAKALAPGRYVVFASADRSNPGLAGSAVDVADGERALVELREVASGTTLAVVLSGPGAAGPEGLHVALVPGELQRVTQLADVAALGAPIEPVEKEPGLTPTFQLLAAGRYTLLVGRDAPGGFALLTVPVDVRGGPPQRLEVEVPEGLPVLRW